MKLWLVSLKKLCAAHLMGDFPCSMRQTNIENLTNEMWRRHALDMSLGWHTTQVKKQCVFHDRESAPQVCQEKNTAQSGDVLVLLADLSTSEFAVQEAHKGHLELHQKVDG